jgi:hypothetical protein
VSRQISEIRNLAPNDGCARRSVLLAAVGSALSATAFSQVMIPGASAPAIPGFPGAPGLPGAGVGGIGGQPKTAEILPYRTIERAFPSRARWRQRVVELLDFNCPYCRQINLGAQSWGETLPKPWKLVQFPVIQDEASFNAATAFLLAVLAAPEKADVFVQACFEAVQTHHESPTASRTYAHAALAAGIRQEDLQRVLKTRFNEVKSQLRDLADLVEAAAPEVTPTFVVDANEVLDVNRTGGDYGRMFQVMNGLISQRLGPRAR